MRLLKLSLGGYRSIERGLEFDAGPFTVLFGKNNAGKTVPGWRLGANNCRSAFVAVRWRPRRQDSHVRAADEGFGRAANLLVVVLGEEVDRAPSVTGNEPPRGFGSAGLPPRYPLA